MADYNYLSDVTGSGWAHLNASSVNPAATPPTVVLADERATIDAGWYERAAIEFAAPVTDVASLDGMSFTVSLRLNDNTDTNGNIGVWLAPFDEACQVAGGTFTGYYQPALAAGLATFSPVFNTINGITPPGDPLYSNTFVDYTFNLTYVDDTTVSVEVVRGGVTLLTRSVALPYATPAAGAYTFTDGGVTYTYTGYAPTYYPADAVAAGSPEGYYGRYFEFDQPAPIVYSPFWTGPMDYAPGAAPYPPADGVPPLKVVITGVRYVQDPREGDFSVGGFTLNSVALTGLFDDDDVEVLLPPGGAIDPAGVTVIEPDYLTANELQALYGITPGSITLIERVSPVMPDPRDVPVTMGRPRASTFTPTSVTRQTLGWVRVVVDGEDVTFLRGVPAQVVDMRETEPFGWQSATVRFPQITGFEDDRYGHAQKFFDGARVAITLRDAAGNKLEDLFHGVIVERAYAVEEGSPPGLDVTCLGLLYTADLCLAKPELMVETQDLADVLQQRLNQVPSRRFLALEPSGPTGIENRDRGAWQPLLTGFVQDALADAITDDGENQWTILMSGRRPVLQLKDRTTVHHSVTLGTPGVSANLTRDVTQSTTTVYGYGVDSDNEAWANLKLPDYDDAAIAWPLPDPDDVLVVGSTGSGVTTLQTRLRRAGYGVTVTGTYDSATKSAVKAYQGSNGLTATGEVDAATWTSIFAAAMNPGLDTAYYAPLSSIGPVEKYRYNADGAITEENPNYDDTRLRVERWHAYADGLSKRQAARAARAETDKDRNPGWVGTITLKVDPETTSRWSIHAGQNILLRGFMGDSRVYDNNPDAGEGRQVLFHIAEVTRDGEGTVTLTVDTEAHDLPTLDAIFVRDKEAVNPARRPGAKRRSETPPDSPVIDGELKGWIDGMPVSTASWSVIKVPVGVEGTIVGIDLVADTATRFAVAMFGSPVTPATMDSITTTPLAWVDEASGIRPFPGTEATADTLESLAWIDTVGGPGEAAGYWPGSEQDGSTLTGKLKDKSIAVPFISYQAPWIWLAVWSETAATFTGRIYLEPQR